MAVAAIALVAFLAPPAAAAGVVDLDLRLAPGEDAGCRQWSGSGSVTWNLTLAMNGTDPSLVTTSTFVWINDTSAPAMRADFWTIVLASSGDQLANPPSYDSGTANELATGSGVFAPAPGTVDLRLYGAQHQPPAPVTNITLVITPSQDSENKDHNFTIVATTHRSGVANVTREVHLCVHIPPKPRFTMGANFAVLQVAPDSDVSVSFWLKNTGNTQDWYFCNVSVPRDGWTWRFSQGINIGPNVTDLTNIQQNITIRVAVHVPASARAHENTTVSLECSSIKASGLGIPYYPSFPYTRIEVSQYYFVSARIVGNATLCGLPGDQVVFHVEVTNNGNGADQGVATLVAPSNLSWQSDITPAEFDLAAYHYAGDNASVEVLITIPLGTVPFTYDFQLNISSALPSKPVTQLRFHVCVKQVYDPQVTQPPAEHAMPGAEVLFSFTIKNAGNGLDSLLIDVANLSLWRVFLSPPLGEKLLQASEEAAFQATVIVPRDVRAGTYNTTVTVTSKYARLDIGADLHQISSLTVIIGETCGVTIDPTQVAWVVDSGSAENGSLPLSFEFHAGNLGNSPAVVALAVEGPGEFSPGLSSQSLTIEPSSSALVFARASVQNSAAPGIYNLTLRATPACDRDRAVSATVRLSVTRGGAGLGQSFTIRVGNISFGGGAQSGASMEAVERTNLTFQFVLHNVGTGEIPAGTPVLYVYDITDCEHPGGAGECGLRIVQTITLAERLGAGESLVVDVGYQVPEVQTTPGRVGPAWADHTLRFVIPPGQYSSTGDVVVIQLRADDSPAAVGSGPTAPPPSSAPPAASDPVVIRDPAGEVLPILAGLAAAAVVAFLIVRRRRPE